MRQTRAELEQDLAILESIERGAYLHGWDLRPVEAFTSRGWISLGTGPHGRSLALRLTKAGRTALDSLRRVLAVDGTGQHGSSKPHPGSSKSQV